MRLSTIITAGKAFVLRHTALRIGCYSLMALGLLLYWLLANASEIAFVYNAF